MARIKRILSIEIRNKPNNCKQTCCFCEKNIKKGEKRVSIPDISYANYGTYFVKYYHFHYPCFLRWLYKHFPELKNDRKI